MKWEIMIAKIVKYLVGHIGLNHFKQHKLINNVFCKVQFGIETTKLII